MKEKIFRIIDDDSKNRFNDIFGFFIVTLIIASVLEIILESYEDINNKFYNYFQVFEIFTVIIFSTEYILRIWTAELKYPNLSKSSARLKFATSIYGLIDLLAILPFFLPFLFKFDLRFIRSIRIIRLLRVFKLHRYTKSLKLIGTVFKENWRELSITIFATFILILISSSLMYNIENEVQPDKFPNIVETFWWALATLTTIGYGDVVPITGWGKFISGIIALLGIGLVALPTGILSAAFFEKIEEEHNSKKDDKTEKEFTYCPHCGEKLKQNA